MVTLTVYFIVLVQLTHVGAYVILLIYRSSSKLIRANHIQYVTEPVPIYTREEHL